MKLTTANCRLTSKFTVLHQSPSPKKERNSPLVDSVMQVIFRPPNPTRRPPLPQENAPPPQKRSVPATFSACSGRPHHTSPHSRKNSALLYWLHHSLLLSRTPPLLAPTTCPVHPWFTQRHQFLMTHTPSRQRTSPMARHKLIKYGVFLAISVISRRYQPQREIDPQHSSVPFVSTSLARARVQNSPGPRHPPTILTPPCLSNGHVHS
jgi:hypothetical protein